MVRSGNSQRKWPSWNTHTIAPNVADSDSVFSTSAFSGSTRLPVNRNSTTNDASTISAIAIGIVTASACRLSALIAVWPVNCTGHGAGTARASDSRCLAASDCASAPICTSR